MLKGSCKHIAVVGFISGMSMLSSLPAAADSNWYAGVGIGSAEVDISSSRAGERLLGDGATGVNTSLDNDDTSYKITVGYDYSKNFAVEAAYVNFGDFNLDANETGIANPLIGSFDADTDGISIAVVGKLPLSNNVSLLGKVGAYYWNSDTDTSVTQSGAPVPINEVDDNGTDFFYGVGAQYDFNKFSLRAEYEVYNDIIEEDYDVYTLNLMYHF